MKFLLTLGTGVYLGYSLRGKKDDREDVFVSLFRDFVSTAKDVTKDALLDSLQRNSRYAR